MFTMAWKRTQVSHMEFLNDSLLHWYSKLLDIPGFLVYLVRQDSLHGLNLGPAAIFGASCLWYMTLRTAGSAKCYERTLAHYWEKFEVWRKSMKLDVSVPLFRRATLNKRKDVNVSNPELKYKAFHVRIIISWLAHELDKEMQDPATCTLLHCPMAVGAYGLANFFNSMDCFPRILSETQSVQMAGEMRTFLAAHLVCSVQCKQDKMMMFQTKPKFHAMIHMMEDILTDRENPKYSWCFGDEDYMGLCSSIAKQTHRSSCMTRSLQRLKSTMIQQLFLLSDG